jgi:gamma-glutamylaminecyclotransferase
VTGHLFEVDDETLAAMDSLERVSEPDGYRRVLIDVESIGSPRPVRAHAYLKPVEQLLPAEVQLGPLGEYGLDHAALYRPRR